MSDLGAMTDDELDQIEKTLDMCVREAFFLIDDYITYEESPSVLAFENYYTTYINRFKRIKETNPLVFTKIFEGLSDLEKAILLEGLEGKDESGRDLMSSYLTGKRKELKMLAMDGVHHLKMVKDARDMLVKYAKESGMDL